MPSLSMSTESRYLGNHVCMATMRRISTCGDGRRCLTPSTPVPIPVRLLKLCAISHNSGICLHKAGMCHPCSNHERKSCMANTRVKQVACPMPILACFLMMRRARGTACSLQNSGAGGMLYCNNNLCSTLLVVALATPRCFPCCRITPSGFGSSPCCF